MHEQRDGVGIAGAPPEQPSVIADRGHAPAIREEDPVLDQAVVSAVWQSGSIGRYVDFRQFAVGRVVDRPARRAMWFLERRRPGSVFAAREPAPGVVVDYPFGG